jgi:hypothetical protein
MRVSVSRHFAQAAIWFGPSRRPASLAFDYIALGDSAHMGRLGKDRRQFTGAIALGARSRRYRPERSSQYRNDPTVPGGSPLVFFRFPSGKPALRRPSTIR